MLTIGPHHFRAMLDGFHEMDEHFRTAPFAQNLPVLMGLLGVWNTNFLGAHTIAVLPYEQYLKRFPAYLQQLTMESNGKHVTLDGDAVSYETSPIYWGEPGTNGQHSFYQLIHQGTRLIPCDFIAFARAAQPARARTTTSSSPTCSRRAKRWPSARPSRKCGRRLTRLAGPPIGRSRATGRRTRSCCRGSRPAALGKLVALYEHIVFTQGVIWNVDSFDQWGVELGKVLAQRILPELDPAAGPALTHDSSTNTLIGRYRRAMRRREPRERSSRST